MTATLGVNVQPKRFAAAVAATNKILDFHGNLDEQERAIYASCMGTEGVARLTSRLAFYERCAALEEQFRVVTFDMTVKRVLKDAQGRQVEVPLLFGAALPAPHITKKKIGDYNFSTKTPSPPAEAVEAMNKHKSKFDALELVWVPKDILVERIPKPDPILVGRVSDGKENVYFELYRWIDEVVEEGWWSKEGY